MSPLGYGPRGELIALRQCKPRQIVPQMKGVHRAPLQGEEKMKMKLLSGLLAGATLIAGIAKAEESISAI